MKYRMATTAIHKLGDISRDKPSLCISGYETATDYVGQWVTGIGFFGVRFPKETTRKLTQEEADYYNSLYIQNSNGTGYGLVIPPDDVEPA